MLTAEGSPAYHPDGSILEPLPPPLNNRPDRSGRGAAALAPAITVKVRAPLRAAGGLLVLEQTDQRADGPLCRPANPLEEIAAPTGVVSCMSSRFISVDVLVFKQPFQDAGRVQAIRQIDILSGFKALLRLDDLKTSMPRICTSRGGGRSGRRSGGGLTRPAAQRRTRSGTP